jgi:predicted SAM-dependent methyltransferase
VESGKVYQLPPNSKPALRRFSVGKKKILDLGCGEIATVLKDGLPVRVDMRDDVNADYRCDVRSLPFATESFDVVFSSHTLEHFEHKQISSVLDEWVRVLKPGGDMRLIVPDLSVAAKQLLDGNISQDTWNVLYGEQNERWNFHRTGFTPKILQELLESKGLKIQKIWQEEPFNLFVEAKKGKATEFVGEGQGRCIKKSDVSTQTSLSQEPS